MDWRDQDTSMCSIGSTLDLVGKPWVMLVMREVFRGLHRFSDIQAHLDVSRPVLSQRLDTLVDAGVLERVPYREPGQRARHEYHLTDKGRDLYPLLTALRDWGDRHLPRPDGPSTVVEHRGCGARVHVALVCENGHGLLTHDDVEARPGPGARPLPGRAT
jgi:DNA-binding HxlR family transcriptional regulator